MDDFERRRELRRQKREEMRLEAERLAYQRNDDDEEEAARERRRRARQERLRQKEEDDLTGQVTEKPEVNAQNNVAEEETKRSTTTLTNTQGEGEDDAAFLERLARREERRQKRLQEALDRQKEFDPTVTDESLSLPSGREINNVEENETMGKEEKIETRRGRYEIDEAETVTTSYQRNNWRQDEEEEKKEEKDKEEVQEEKAEQRTIEENQVEVTLEKKTIDKEEGPVVLEVKTLDVNVEKHKAENDTSVPLVGEPRAGVEAINLTLVLDHEKLRNEEEEKTKEEKKRTEERERLEAEERERVKAEEQKKAEERARIEAEEKRAAQEKERIEAEERERIQAEEQRAAEERERAKAEEKKRAAEEKAKLEEEKLKAKQKVEDKKIEDKKVEDKQVKEKKIEEKQVKGKKVQEEKPQTVSLRKQGEEKEVKVEAKKEKLPDEKLQPAFKKQQQIKDDKANKDKAPKEEVKPIWDRKKGFPEPKPQNGERFQEPTTHKLKHTENIFSRSGMKATTNAEDSKPVSQAEAGKRLEELRRRRGENESEEFEKLKEKQQEAAVELEELKKKREERRKILEEEEQRRKQEEAERKAREEEEKRRLKEDIERRRAEAAEKRQKMPEDGLSDDKKPFKCFTPKGSSLKIEERAEFLNKSAQKSGAKPTHSAAIVSKIDSRLEQYTSAIEGTKTAKPAKPAPSDLPVPAEGVRNIKSMWEKGNVFSSPSAPGTTNKETAGLKVGVSSRINEWLTKTPDTNKSPAPKPSDLRPGDVSNKRNLWEKQSNEKATSPSKVTAMGKKSETNAGLRQFEKEP
ncbi:caldesmon isoform X7 [Dermochelys coriacea]|uniref:caldesmon isoform X6 n=1 Tax=Dermochelys coriacea TaxID=27794 RepID=UPI001CA8C5E4|nr:caldesmon isoform X6 [Dermochelys coriacea]XP_043373119.1 caldesmon isoform X7 [Dermochelys coriacea]